MSGPAPTARALAGTRELLRALSSARQVFHLYEVGHPNRQTVLRDLRRQALAIRAAWPDGSDPVLFVTRHSFYLGPTLMARESLSLYRLIEAFERAGVEAVEFLADVTEEDADTLVRMLLGELPETARVHGLAINRVTPMIAGDEAAGAGGSELRKGYGIGLDLLRETAMRAGANRPVDMRQTTEVVDRLTTTILADPAQALLLTTVKSYDEYTYYHMVNVCLLTIALGHAVGLRRDQIVALGIGALLHDVGKMNVPGDVLNHVGPLSDEQWRVVQRHPVDGAGLVFGTSDGLYHPAATVVLEHHAGFDLTGYPRLTRRSLPSLPARLVAVADCFDAVTSNRAYRRAEERRQALNILVAGSGRGFDPRVVRSFVRLLGLFPVGSLVELTSGDVCVVLRPGKLLARPIVRRVLDQRHDPVDGEEIDLSAVRDDGTYRWDVTRSLDPNDLDIDMTVYLASGDVTSPKGMDGSGLVHEPSFGERAPTGYVDTHNEEHGGDSHSDALLGLRPDPDVAPPIEG